jgi:hypothetical protein
MMARPGRVLAGEVVYTKLSITGAGRRALEEP